MTEPEITGIDIAQPVENEDGTVETVNDTSPEVAHEVTRSRAEQPTEVARPAEPAPMLGPLPDLGI